MLIITEKEAIMDTISNTIAIHPSEFIRDSLEYFKMSQDELANRIGMTPKAISNIMNGKSNITPETAMKLEKVFGTPASFWISAQGKYDEYQNRIREEQLIEQKENQFYKKLSLNLLYNKLVKIGCLEKCLTRLDAIRSLQSFLGVSSFSLLESTFNKQLEGMAFKPTQNINKYDFIAWLTCGRTTIRSRKIDNYDASKFKDAIREARKFSFQQIEDVWDKLVKLYESAGVYLVYTPCIGKSSVYGYTEWLSGNPVIHLSLRGSADYSWHSLFHESCHVIQDKRTKVFIDYSGTVISEGDDEDEKRAHKFASELLIKDADLRANFNEYNFRNFDWGIQIRMVEDFSAKKNILPAITVARLQRLGIINYKTHLNSLKKKK